MILTDKEFLVQRCDPCATIQEGMEICKQLAAELDRSPTQGIGLAAPQIGIQKSACIIRTPEVDPQGFRYNIEIWFVNPKITKLVRPVIFGQEGCLSFPDKCVKTLRYAACKVVDDLEPTGWDLVGMRAIVAQHEIQHLDGRTMFDVEFENMKPKQPCPCGSGQAFKLCCRPKAKELVFK